MGNQGDQQDIVLTPRVAVTLAEAITRATKEHDASVAAADAAHLAKLNISKQAHTQELSRLNASLKMAQKTAHREHAAAISKADKDLEKATRAIRWHKETGTLIAPEVPDSGLSGL